MDEREFFNNGNVSVSLTRFVVAGQTYAMSGVTSVRSGHIPPSRLGPVLLGVFGTLFMFTASAVMMLIGVGLLLLAGYIWTQQAPVYTVLLSSSSGEAKALTSLDRDFIASVVQALNDCIVARG